MCEPDLVVFDKENPNDSKLEVDTFYSGDVVISIWNEDNYTCITMPKDGIYELHYLLGKCLGE